MKKRSSLILLILCLSLVICLLSILLVGCSKDPEKPREKFVYKLLSDDTYEIAKNNSFDKAIDIPSEYNGKKVTKIGKEAFLFNNITSVTIPYGITTIGENAFKGCREITSIILPNSITCLENGAFEYCDKLTSITIPSSATNIGDGVFADCYTLTDITLPDGITKIGDYLFYDCFELKDITIPSSVKSIGYRAFKGCIKLEYLTIPEGVISLGDESFWHTGMRELTIPSTLQNIGASAFCDTCLIYVHIKDIDSWCNIKFGDMWANPLSKAKLCINGEVVTNVEVSEKVTNINDYAFYYCKGIKNVKIPYGVKSIGCSAFEGSFDLENVIVSTRLTSIEDRAFYDCAYLKNITIPDGLTKIGGYAFYECSKLESIIIPSSCTTIGDWTFRLCLILEIKCGAPRQPEGWSEYWNSFRRPVEWGYKG